MKLGPARWWILLVAMGAGLLWLDLVTGPFIMFPITFVIPVALGAWHLGRQAGLGLAVGLVACRLAIALTLEAAATPPWAAGANAVIRLIVLGALSSLVATVRHRNELAARVRTLEGLLQICCVCKKIRREDGSWQAVESYVRERSPVDFSHGLCEACLLEHYPEYADRTTRS